MLTEHAIRALRLGTGKSQTKLFDTGGVRGLYFLMTPGAKGWRLRYYRGNKEHLISLGPWPEVSLAEARRKAGRLREQIRKGGDPAEALKRQKAAAVEFKEKSFGVIAHEVLSLDDDKAPRTRRKHEWLFALLKPLHPRPIRDLRTPEIVRLLREIQEHLDRRETAHRCASFVNRVCRFAVQSGYAETNPAADLRGALKPLKVESHAAITDPSELSRLLAHVWAYDLIGSTHPTIKHALQVLTYTFVRPGELRKAEWPEFNLDKAEWLIPAQRMKMRRPHYVPLARQVVEILRAQQEISGKGRYVFPGRLNSHLPLSDGTLGKALRIMGFSSDTHTAHGFRSTASTLLNGELHLDSAIVELQLAHQKSDAVAAIYDRAQRLPERREMMQRWADYLDQLRAAYRG